MRRIRIVLFALALTVSLRAMEALSILFIGNSYTQVNDLPQVFRQVVAGAGQTAPTVSAYLVGGQTLDGFSKDPAIGPKLEPHYDVVVVQEQSLVPAIAVVDPAVQRMFLEGGQRLMARIRVHNPGARIVFFETWAREAGVWPNGVDLRAGESPSQMQERLMRSYAQLARRCGGVVAPVGEAWRMNYSKEHPIPLHVQDGSHPAWAGTYLAALVLAKTIYDPALRTTYAGQLPAETAKQLSGIATATVAAKRVVAG